MTEILTLNGQMIVRKSFESVENLHLPQGMYLCKLYKHDGNTNIIKLMMK